MIVDGIVIRSVPVKEKDAMITVINKDGITSFYAKGVLSLKSKNSPSLNLYTYGRYDLNQGPQSGLSLKEGTIIESFSEIMNHFESLAVASFIDELTCKCVQSEDAYSIFPYLLNCLKALKNNFDPLTIANIYFASLLNGMGIGLEVDYCVISHQKSNIVAISFADGGFISRSCFKPETCDLLDARMLNIYRYLFRVSEESVEHIAFGKEENIAIFKKLSDYLYNQTNTSLTSIELMLKI
ncbi:MAG: DNA repair protein RecO [Bacilli bacterium]|jgi:DNA repair protein RecO